MSTLRATRPVPSIGSGNRDRIGPNAILQLDAPLSHHIGDRANPNLLEAAGIPLPTGEEMIPQQHVVRAHAALLDAHPKLAATIATEAGVGTAHYIIENRIPPPARTLLRYLPTPLAVAQLTKAIQRHAWTFCGTGRLTAHIQPFASHRVEFAIWNNPIARGRCAPHPSCHWHRAVFETLYSTLLARPFHAREIACCSCGEAACRFVVDQS
ncbi:MAG: bacteriochlorophyll 4-vinyl reductase [Pseudomonadota bacterium]